MNTTKRLETRSCASACTHGLRHAHDLIVGQFSVLLLLVRIRSGSVHFSTMTHGIVMKDRDTRGGSSSATKGAEPTVRRVVTRERGQLTFSLDTLSLGAFSFPRARPFSALHCLPAFVRGHGTTLLPSYGVEKMDHTPSFNNFSRIIPILFTWFYRLVIWSW